jgi:arylsulfatase A-like enzyme
MKRLASTRTLLASSMLAAAAVGFVEATGMSLVGEPAGGFGRALAAWATSASLASLGALPLAILLLLVMAFLAWLRIGQDAWRDLVAGGAARALVVWRLLVAAAAVGVFAVLSFKLSAWTYEQYPKREPPLFGAFIAVGTTAFVALLAFVGLAIDRQVGARVASSGWAVRAVGGRPMLVAVIVLGILTIVVPCVILRTAIPDMHPIVAIGACSLLVIVLVVRATRIGQRPRAQIAALAAFLAVVGGFMLVAGSDAGRSRIVSRGLVSRSAFVALSRSPLSDRDGDMFPARFFGGADCDDSRPKYNPHGIDVPGNGIDENCTGADADPAWVDRRFTPRPPSNPAAPKYNVLVVSVDCMRPDHTGAHGYGRDTTPTFDRLAATGTRFDWAFTVQPTTRLAVASLLTGRHPSTLLWSRRMKLHWKASKAVGMGQVFKDAGYDTALIACCDRFDRIENELGGFMHHDKSPIAALKATPGQANSGEIARGAIDWLGKRAGATKPFFLWTHLIDLHTPYEVPSGGVSFGRSDLDRYDSELQFADHNIGLILAKIDELGLTEKTIVVITADHGEEFMEHGIKFHSRSLFNQVARIPLVVRYPGVAARVIGTPVSLMDVMPTLLDLVGLPGPSGMNGVSLADAIRGTGDAPDRPVLMEVYPQKNIERDLIAIAYRTWKVIWDREANSFSLFSLTDDADDTHDLAPEEPERLAELQAMLFETIDRELSSTLEQPRQAKKGKKK